MEGNRDETGGEREQGREGRREKERGDSEEESKVGGERRQ